MENKVDDIQDLAANYHNLDEIIKKKLYSIRNELRISFIGKMSTPKNLFINQLTNVNFLSYNTSKITPYCTIISEWHDGNRGFSVIPEYKEAYQTIKTNYESNKTICGIFYESGATTQLIENLGTYLNEDINKDVDIFEICLPKSENSILNQGIIYNNPPIGYSDKLDEFVVEQSYKSCYLYIFVINKDESILEEEMKIIELLMKKRNVIEVKFVIACSRDMSREDYIKIEQDYNYKIKKIREKFPGIIIISGHGYIFYGENENSKSNDSDSKDSSPDSNTISNEEEQNTNKIINNVNNEKESGDKSLHTNIIDVVSKENKINDLGNFIRENPTEEMIWTAVKSYRL